MAEPNHGPVCVGLDNGCVDCQRIQAFTGGVGSSMVAGAVVSGAGAGAKPPLTVEMVAEAIERGLTDADAEISRAAWQAVTRRLRTLFSRNAAGT